jgi:hypothetical protein
MSIAVPVYSGILTIKKGMRQMLNIGTCADTEGTVKKIFEELKFVHIGCGGQIDVAVDHKTFEKKLFCGKCGEKVDIPEEIPEIRKHIISARLAESDAPIAGKIIVFPHGNSDRR